MYDVYDDLVELCDTISKEIQAANSKIRSSGGKISAGDLEYIDVLTHILKSIKTTKAMMDAEENGSYNDGSYADGMGMGTSRPYMYRSNARGRGRNARRDSMGRYTGRRAYDDGMISELHELMEDAPNESIKAEIRQLISKIENQM